MPTLVVETAQQRRHLCADIDGLVARQTIAQCVQRAEQGGMHLAPVMPIEAAHEVVDPFFGFGKRRAEILYLRHDQGLADPAISTDAARIAQAGPDTDA